MDRLISSCQAIEIFWTVRLDSDGVCVRVTTCRGNSWLSPHSARRSPSVRE